MRAFYKGSTDIVQLFGETYECNHVLYNRCTLYKIQGKGLAVIQQRYDPKTKHMWWDEIDSCLANDIYLSNKFIPYFRAHASEPDKNGIYPTVKVRKLMWALRLNPMRKEAWEE